MSVYLTSKGTRKTASMPLTGRGSPLDFETLWLHIFEAVRSQIMKLSAVRVCRSFLPGRFLVLISVKAGPDLLLISVVYQFG
jgi:hypothetical protein